MDVSVIIINYNTCQMTSECIDSILSHTSGIEYEIILVDNASTDGSKEFFEKDKRVRYIYSKTNRGFGAGNNLGVKNASGKYIFLLNSDTLLKNNAIKMLYDFSESQSASCVCGAWLINRDGKPTVSEIDFPRMTISEFIADKLSGNKKKCHSGNKNVDVVCGAAMFLPKHVYDCENGFDEQIFMYGEEVELQYRLKKSGISRIIIDGPEIIHFGGGSGANYSPKLFKSHFFFLKKHMTQFNYCCARIYYAFNLLTRKMLGGSSIQLKDAFMKI